MRTPRFESLVCRAGALLLAVGLSACTSPAQRIGNYDLCAANRRGCDEARLDMAQKHAIAREREHRHLQDCLARLRCNDSALTAAQREQVRVSVNRLNFDACLQGEASCDPGRLDAVQQTQVQTAARRRNVETCLAGLKACDHAALTSQERDAARDAYLQRNFSGCMNAIGTMVGCKLEDLTSAQREQVRGRRLAVNYFFCVNGVVTCEPTLLTEEQRALIARN